VTAVVEAALVAREYVRLLVAQTPGRSEVGLGVRCAGCVPGGDGINPGLNPWLDVQRTRAADSSGHDNF
jgi:hypothetical protein